MMAFILVSNKLYSFKFEDIIIMLKYREYLEQSRARRGTHQHPPHFESQGVSGQEIKSHENIKNFVSQPGYGEIFYSEDNRKVEPAQHQLKNFLQSERSKTQQLKTYMTELEQENMELKNRLSQVLQQQQVASNSNIQSRKNYALHAAGHHVDHEQEYAVEANPPQNINHHHVAQPSFNANTNQQFRGRPVQPRLDYNSESSIPFAPSRVQHNHQSNVNYNGQYHPPSFVQPVQSEPLYQQYEAPMFMGSRQSLPVNSAYPLQSGPTGSRPQSPQYAGNAGKNSASSLFTLAKQKLNAVKDDDEELRQYTIELLRRS